MKNNMPFVSIVMPVYNGKKYLTTALESVLAQTYRNWELIVIDDASTDSTSEILKEYSQKEARLRYITNPTQNGIAKSLNLGMGMVMGKYVARMDADDVMDRERIEKQVEYLEKHPAVVAVGTFMREIDGSGKILSYRKLPVGHEKIYAMMNYMMGMQHPTLMFNRQVIPATFGWYKNISMAEDLDLLFRLAKLGKFANIPDYLHDYRVHTANASLRSLKETFQKALLVRMKARKAYGYKPSWKAKLLQLLSRLAIKLFPDDMIYSAYQLIRKA